jgi:hypothetical protein
MDTPGYFTIEQCVYSAFNRQAIDTKFFEQMATIAVEYLTEHNIFYKKGGKDALLDVSVTNTVDLPSDYVDYIRIGIIINGKIWTLGLNEDIPFTSKLNCGVEETPDDNITVPASIENYVAEHQNMPVFMYHYGVSGGQNYSKYRIDKERRQIIFDTAIPYSKIYIEYVSSGVSIDGETYVPRQVVPCIRQYLIWQALENDPRVPMNEKERKMAQYEKELRLLNSFDNAFTVDEFKDMLYETSRQTPKR